MVDSLDGAQKQEVLRTLWLEAKTGALPAREQAKAWALREAWRDSGKAEHGMLTYIAGKLIKSDGEAPQSEAVKKLFGKIDGDDDWFPGKANYEKMGAPALLTRTNRALIARSAMALKQKGVEPTYGRVIAACPKAALNPATKQPFGKTTIYSVLSEECYDEDPCLPWEHKFRYSKAALSSDMREKRAQFAKLVRSWTHNNTWYYNHLVWTDLCSSIIPTSEKKANEMALARKGKKGWQSPGSELSSQNLPGNPYSLHQNSWDTMRIWWFPMLCRGKLHVDCFDGRFPGETPQGASCLVEKVRAAVNVRFQNVASKPDTLFTDRGRGFYMTNSGSITAEYAGALAQNDFQAIMGENAVLQPGSLQDVLLHETAVSWLRHRLSRSTPPKCWQESREEYGRRLKRCCEEVNQECDVEGLCKGLPKRMKLLQDKEGDRLKK